MTQRSLIILLLICLSAILQHSGADPTPTSPRVPSPPGSGNGNESPRSRPPRVLMVVSSVNSWTPTTGPDAGHPRGTGMWLAEFTHSWTVFNNSGFTIDVASPLGGNAKPDPQGYAFYRNDPDTRALVVFNDSDLFNSRLPPTEHTLRTDAVNASNYDAIFLVGGTGAMFDFPFDTSLARVAGQLWESGKIVSAVCHGPIGLTNVRLSTGKLLVDGKLMTGFSNDEEHVLGDVNKCVFCWQRIAALSDPDCDLNNPFSCHGPYMPTEYYVKRTPFTGTPDPNGQPSFLLETKLKELGAKYVSTYQNWSTFYCRPHVVRDGRLVTGQNPGAGRETAQAVVAAVADLRRGGRDKADKVLESTFCTAIQQTASDPAVVCTTEGGRVRGGPGADE